MSETAVATTSIKRQEEILIAARLVKSAKRRRESAVNLSLAAISQR